MREHVAVALDAITLTFRVGPVLTDPETVRMPLPAEIRGNWSWVRRTNATVWKEDIIAKETDQAKLSDTSATFTEGWLKLGGAMKTNQEEGTNG